MMDGAHRFIESQIAQASQQRSQHWNYDFSSAENYSASLDDHRKHLRQILGVVDSRDHADWETYGNDENPAMITETDKFQVFQVRWQVFGPVQGHGLLVQPRPPSLARCILVPDADQEPEELLGMTSNGNPAPARLLAESGWELLIPTIVSRQVRPAPTEQLARAKYTQREWIYRQAFHLGRHVIGYDIQRILAGADWLTARSYAANNAGPPLPLGIAGYGEGGLIAWYTSALDSRFDVTLLSGCFTDSDLAWSEPIYRNVWSRGSTFGSAELASMILPRRLIIEHSPFPQVEDHKGALTTPEFATVEQQWKKIPQHPNLTQPLLVSNPKSPIGPWSAEVLEQFATAMTGQSLIQGNNSSLVDLRKDVDLTMETRRNRTVNELESHVQLLVRQSEHVRDDFFLYQARPEFRGGAWSTERTHPVHPPETLMPVIEQYRERFYREAMGRFDTPLLPSNARTRKVAETEHWTAYDVVLDVHQDLFAWGILVLPKDLKPGERRPVVVCQHGRNGVPRDTLDRGTSAYNDFAGKLAERGFITFAPHNLYRGEDRYRWLDRKANAVGCSLFSFIIAQHDQILRWLATQPYVDEQRIAFYGLSYGGETAVRVPTVLPQYCLSICSGDFNQWTRKVAATDQPFSFMNTIEWEMPYWNLGNTFDYAEMTYLMFPRPFMVERGHHDRVGRDQWVAHEFAKVRWLYAQFGLADKLDVQYFQGGHSIYGDRTFEFLHKHLGWPNTEK
ncbi:MAG: dienelactone hydrolase family protein [Planctomycetales bacterium]|nr:dienelactone hydrolase family protein [Planctomycetales bacterium]